MNVTEQKTKSLPPLVKMQSSYKMIVPAKVEEKIRYLLRKFPSTEWSGVLFFTHEGSFETDDLVITCQDVYPMDLGSATFTEFNMSEEVAGYMADNIELFDCDLGLCHSHHNMETFFSGTDTATLREEGNERNCFVSLIVNNAGTYNAAITRKVQAQNQITVIPLAQSYEFFGSGSIPLDDSENTTTTIVNDEEIQYFMLNVEREEVSNPFEYLDKRFDDISNKKLKITTTYTSKYPYSWIPTKNNTDKEYGDFYEWLHKDRVRKENKEELCLFDKKEMEDMKTTTWEPNPALIHSAVARMVTCNLILKTDSFDLKQWIVKHLNNVYGRIFDESEKPDSFELWSNFITDFTVATFVDDTAPAELYEDNSFVSIVVDAMINELWEYGDNPYIREYIDKLQILA